MKIAVLSHNPNAYSYRRYMEAAQNKGHELSFIHMSYCYMNISSTAPTVFYRDYDTFKNLDAIIPRINSSYTFYGTAVLRQFELMNVFTLNSSLSITWSRDKLRTLQLLARKRLPLPITGFADSPEETEKLVDVVGGAPLIIRLLEGTQGKGTIFAETHQAAISVINAFKQLNTNILVQEYIKEANGMDIRCVIVGNKVVAALQRIPNEAGKGKRGDRLPRKFTSPITLTFAEKKIALQTAKAMKLNFATIDIIRSSRGPLVLDVDCSPSIEILEKTTGVNIADPIIEFIEERVQASR